ncbi:MAG TPA: hypothetical protein VF031_06215 [Alphaproteobacteria bacterium]
MRIGAVNLAVGDSVGGNAFEVLFLAAISRARSTPSSPTETPSLP